MERATVEAVAPPEVVELDGWLVPLDNGTIGRAKSAVPLRHDAGPDALGEIEAIYRARRLKPAFRMADVASLAPVCAALAGRGYAHDLCTVVEIGSAAELAAFSDGPARILSRPDAAWAGVFTGEGFDPVDGAHRVAALTRSPSAVYAAAGEDGGTNAVGVVTFGHGWAGIHGMRTAPAHRGKGHAAAILAALGREAVARGFERVFLDVVEDNPARAIYRRAGFTMAWRYRYWSA
ncbi:MAG TPA: GNAT family N-acetyltransferase [Phenylobacterium sp.]